MLDDPQLLPVGTRSTLTERAGLQMPVAHWLQFDAEVRVGLAGLLEYITAQLMECGGNQVRKRSWCACLGAAFIIAIDKDEELKGMCVLLGVDAMERYTDCNPVVPAAAATPLT